MKKLIIASATTLGLLLCASPIFATTPSELDVQYETLKYTSDMIVDANRSIIKTLPCERELAKKYSAAQLAKMLTQLKNVMSANTDHLEILIEVIDTMYNELKK